MFEVILGTVLGLNIMVMMWSLMKNNQIVLALDSLQSKVKEGIDDVQIEIPGLHTLRNELVDVISQMRPPTAMDHIGGVLSALAMKKFMPQLPEEMLEMAPQMD